MPKSGKIYDELKDIAYRKSISPLPRDTNVTVNYRKGDALYGDPETKAKFIPKAGKNGNFGTGSTVSPYEEWKNTPANKQSDVATAIQNLVAPTRTGVDKWYGTYDGPGTDNRRYQALHIVPMLDRLARDLATNKLSLPELTKRAKKYSHLILPSVPKGVSPRIIPSTRYGRASFFKKLVDGNSEPSHVKYPDSNDL